MTTRLAILRSTRGLDHAADTERLAREIPELAGESLTTVHRWYRAYSDDTMAAGWICGPDVEGFRAWLLSEVGP